MALRDIRRKKKNFTTENYKKVLIGSGSQITHSFTFFIKKSRT